MVEVKREVKEVKFKNSTKWTAENKRKLITKAVTDFSGAKVFDLFDSFSPEFWNLKAKNLARAYYTFLEKEPEAVESLLEELSANNVKFRSPYRAKQYKKKEDLSIKAIVAEEPVLAKVKPTEEDLFLSISKLVKGIMSLNGVGTEAFINGFASIIEKATKPDTSPLVEEKEKEISALNKEIDILRNELDKAEEVRSDLTNRCTKLSRDNEKLKEDFVYINSVIEDFMSLDPASKICNMNKITKDLKVTIDGQGNVIKVNKE